MEENIVESSYEKEEQNTKVFTQTKDLPISTIKDKLSCYYKYIFHSQIDNYFSKKK